MKIICDSCNAKYSIADEKVKGKVFKIRCKKCSNIIVVRGSKDRAESAEPVQKETQVFDYQDPTASGEWHIVLNDQQVGPMTADAVRERFSAGDIADDTFVWKDGMADWEPLAAVSEFADLASDNEKTVANVSIDKIHAESVKDEQFSDDASFDSLTNQEDPDDLFSQNAGLPSSQDEAAAAAMFGSAGGESKDIFGDHSVPEETDKKLIGQRSDNSVLFSLSDLAQGENASAQSAAAAAPAAAGGVTEGSGLIDIRSMAQMYLGDQENDNSGSGVGSDDDLPVFNQTGFDHAAPVLIPSETKEDKKLLYVLFGAVALLSLLFIGLLGYTFFKSDGDKGSDTTEQPVAVTDKDNKDEVEDKIDEPSKPATEVAKNDEPAKADEVEPVDEPPAVAETPPTVAKNQTSKNSSKKDKRNKKDSKKSNTKKTVTKVPEPKKDPVKSATSTSGCDEIACLVTPGKACCKKYNRKSSSSNSKSSSSSNLPVQLTKSDVTKGISKIRGRVKACGDKHKGKGTVFAKMKIAGSGRVSSVNTSGGSSTLQRCVASAVKKASFRKTQKGMSVKYPFSFK